MLQPEKYHKQNFTVPPRIIVVGLHKKLQVFPTSNTKAEYIRKLEIQNIPVFRWKEDFSKFASRGVDANDAKSPSIEDVSIKFMENLFVFKYNDIRKTRLDSFCLIFLRISRMPCY